MTSTIAVSLVYIVVLGAVIAAVAGYMAGLIGSSNSPVSGVGILAVIGASVLLVMVYGHGGNPEQTKALVASGAVCIAYETITGANGGLPLLAPMSEVAGRMSVLVATAYMEEADRFDWLVAMNAGQVLAQPLVHALARGQRDAVHTKARYAGNGRALGIGDTGTLNSGVQPRPPGGTAGFVGQPGWRQRRWQRVCLKCP